MKQSDINISNIENETGGVSELLNMFTQDEEEQVDSFFSSVLSFLLITFIGGVIMAGSVLIVGFFFFS